MLENYLPTSAAQKQQSYSSTGRCTRLFCSHCQLLLEHEFLTSMDRKSRTNYVTSSFFWSYVFGLFSLGLCERLCVQPKSEYTGELKALITAATAELQRTCYSASGKMWTVSGMYAELQMALIVKCYRTQQLFHMCVNKIVSVNE